MSKLNVQIHCMDASIWGPHYWFFLHTVAFHYPIHPTSIQKKMYHRLIHHFYEFIPNKSMASVYESILQKYPVSPYLDSRDEFIKWMHHLHNKINERLDKPTMTLEEHQEEFLKHFETPPTRLKRIWKEKINLILVLVVGITYLWYRKNVSL